MGLKNQQPLTPDFERQEQRPALFCVCIMEPTPALPQHNGHCLLLPKWRLSHVLSWCAGQNLGAVSPSCHSRSSTAKAGKREHAGYGDSCHTAAAATDFSFTFFITFMKFLYERDHAKLHSSLLRIKFKMLTLTQNQNYYIES